MIYYKIEGGTLTGIADAIRAKNGEYVAAVVHPWPGELYTLVAGN